MTTWGGPHTYNKMDISELMYNRVFISPVGVQNRDLVQKVPIGILQNITNFLCFLIVYYSYSYRINVLQI